MQAQGKTKYDFVLCDVGGGGGGKSKYDFVLCNVRGGGTNLILLDTWGG